MKDNFSKQAKVYSQFRPGYSDEIVEFLVSFVKNKDAALDVATGNGQVAAKLSRHFDKVYATDISQKQLDNAIQEDNIIYSVSKAEETAFEDGQFDLIVVAQAIHWFNFDAFYKEVKRTLKPDGIFAVMGYGRFSTNAESDKYITKLHEEILESYWDSERKLVDEDYKTIPFPFEEVQIEDGKFVEKHTWDFEHLLGYIESWSAVQHYRKKNNDENPVDLIREKLEESWENSDKQVTFPLLLRIGKISDLRR